jgi:cytosine/adenosine deaminase-related metal-dependent hydrolase
MRSSWRWSWRLACIATCASVAACSGTAGNAPPDRVLEEDGGALDGASGADGDTRDGGDATDDGSSGPATVVPGAPDRILLLGTVVAPDTTFVGQVLVEGERITCVEAGDACASKAGAAGATIVDTHGIILPGMIDTHNHILFDIFDGDDWTPTTSFADHNAWTSDSHYAAVLDTKQCIGNDAQGRPAWCPAAYQGTGSVKCEMDKWGELKGLVAGTTSIVGLAGTQLKCFASLTRTLDGSQNDLKVNNANVDRIATSALFPVPNPTSTCAAIAAGTTKSFLVHCGEGKNQAAHDELTTLSNANGGCLLVPQTAITHATAFDAAQLAMMGQKGMKITWSPTSNVGLYGITADIPMALANNVLVALAPDWSLGGGGQNMLDEMRFADAWDDAHFGNKLDAAALVAMTTKNAAVVSAYDDMIGKLAVGYYADIVVYGGSRATPYASIVAARPKDVRLTMVGGKALYGDAALKPLGPTAPGCEDVTICGASKFLCVAEAATTDKLDQTYAQIKAALEAALTDADAVRDPALYGGSAFTFAPLAPLAKCN